MTLSWGWCRCLTFAPDVGLTSGCVIRVTSQTENLTSLRSLLLCPFFLSYARSYFHIARHGAGGFRQVIFSDFATRQFLFCPSEPSCLEDSLCNLTTVFLRPPLESFNVPSPPIHLIQRDTAVQANRQLHGGLRKEFANAAGSANQRSPLPTALGGDIVQ